MDVMRVSLASLCQRGVVPATRARRGWCPLGGSHDNPFCQRFLLAIASSLLRMIQFSGSCREGGIPGVESLGRRRAASGESIIGASRDGFQRPADGHGHNHGHAAGSGGVLPLGVRAHWGLSRHVPRVLSIFSSLHSPLLPKHPSQSNLWTP